MTFPFKRTAATRLLFFIALDTVSIALSVWLAFLLRFDGAIPGAYSPFLAKMIALEAAVVIPVFYLVRLYAFSWAYVSANEAISLFLGTTLSFVVLFIIAAAMHSLPGLQNFPRSTVFISYVLVFVFCGMSRFSKRLYAQIARPRSFSARERVLIIGAGDAGEQIARNMLASSASLYFPVGFADDNSIKQGVTIHGLKVLGRLSDVPRLVKAYQVRTIIIAFPSANPKAVRRAVELAKESKVRKIKIAPPLSEIIRGEVSLKNLRDVDVEDLLGRESVDLDTQQISHSIKGRKVLVTGAAGSIGSELARQIAKFKPALLAVLDQDETGIFAISNELKEKFPGLRLIELVADVCDKKRIGNVFQEYAPEIVFHAAAYKHVPLMEAQPGEAVRNNVFGLKVMADTSLRHGVERFIFISTDKAVNPSSVMGSTKRLGELICQSYQQKGATKFMAVRFGNVLNSRGSVIPIFKEQIRRGGPVEVTHPGMQRYFMLIGEACLLVMQAGAMGNGGEVFVLDMGKPVKILDLAREMVRLSGFEPDKDIAITFTGIRPGEKLFEEILSEQEGNLSTRHTKIFISKPVQANLADLEADLASLEQALGGETRQDEIAGRLKAVISHYR